METQGPDLDYLDTKFEQFWQGDEAKEREHILAVANVIQSFVEKSAVTRASWSDDYLKLKGDLSQGTQLAKKDQERLDAYATVFGDLPERSNRQFATRDVHRKTHGCFKARITINSDLDPAYQKGLFMPGNEYDAVVRFSNGNPRNNSDYAPDARGMAVKFLPPGTLPAGTDLASLSAMDLNTRGLLDILTINFPVFFVNDPLVYAKVNEFFLADHDDILEGKKFEELLSVAIGGMSIAERILALKVNGSIIHNLLYQQWFSMAPSRLGDHSDPARTAVKYLIEPQDARKGDHNWPSWSSWEEGRNYQLPGTSLVKIPDDIRKAFDADRNYLRTRLDETLSSGDFVMSLKIQPFDNPVDTPIEDSTQIWHWSEEERDRWLDDLVSLPLVFRKRKADNRKCIAPVDLATIRITKDGGQTNNFATCEDLSFNPWNNVSSAHKPLGIIQRVKRAAYNASRRSRFRINQIPSHLE